MPESSNTTCPDGQVLPSAVCSRHMNSRWLRGIILKTLQTHFYFPNHLITPEAARLVGNGWRADETTGVLIASTSNWKPELTQKRPAVLVRSGDTESLPPRTYNHAVESDVMTGEREFTKHKQTVLTCVCLGREEDEADVLAHEVDILLDYNALEFQDAFALERFEIQTVTAAKQHPEWREHFAAMVPVLVGFARSYSLTPDAPRFKRLKFRQTT